MEHPEFTPCFGTAAGRTNPAPGEVCGKQKAISTGFDGSWTESYGSDDIPMNLQRMLPLEK